MLNPKTVNVLLKSNEIESFGTGFERTYKACEKANVLCSYENTMTGFRFIFSRNHDRLKEEELSETEKEIYTLLKDSDYLKNEEIAKRIHKSTKTVYRSIKALKEKGYLQREGTNQDGYWKILK